MLGRANSSNKENELYLVVFFLNISVTKIRFIKNSTALVPALVKVLRGLKLKYLR